MTNNELTDQEREELEDSLSDDTNLLSGQGCTDGIGYAPTIARYCQRSDLTAINAYFAACDKAWQEYMTPLIEKCMDRQYASEKKAQEEFYASPKGGGQADTDMKPAPTTTGTQAQMQVQRTIPEPVSPSQADWLINRFHYRADVVTKLTKTQAAALLHELWKRENGG